MNPTITLAAASEHAADLRRYAEEQRKASAISERTEDESIVALRLAYPDDARDVKRLADLDDAPALVEPAMLAIVDGKAVAALSLSDGRVVANPFVPTEKAVALLRLRAKQLSGERHHRWRPRILRPRIA